MCCTEPSSLNVILCSMGLMLHFGCSGSHLHTHSHGISVGGSHSHGHHPLNNDDTDDDQAVIIQEPYTNDESSSIQESIQV